MQALDVRIRLLGDVALIHGPLHRHLGPPRRPLALRLDTLQPLLMDILEQLNDGYIRSVRESDVAWFERHLADDFVNSNPDGTLVDRAGFLKQIARPQVRDLRCEDVRIRVLGEVAIIHARTVYTRPDGTPAAGRYTDVWARRGGKWLCVCADVTRG